jgi:hemolysin activation/secretion protein
MIDGKSARTGLTPARGLRRTGMLFLASAAFLPNIALAQAVPPGSLPTREQVQPPVPQAAAPSSQVDVDGSRAFRETPCAFENATAQVAVGQVVYTGLNGAPLAPELTALLARVQGSGSEGPLSVVCDIRDAANAALRDAGYVASVQIPPQEIVGGVLTLSVITARLVDVRVEGETGRYTNLIAGRAERLKGIDPFNQNDAERLLLLAGDVPGLDVQLSLSPAGTAPGEVIGTLSVAYRPYSIVGNVQNYGSRNIGRESAYMRVDFYGLTGLGDATFIGGSRTIDPDEQQVLQVGHGFALDDDGTRLEGSFTYAWSQPDLGILDIKSRSLVGTVALSSPLVRSTRRNVNLTSGLDFIEQRTRFFDQLFNRDKLRVGFLRLDGNLVQPATDKPGFALSGGLELRRGLDILGATERFAENEITAPPVRGITPSRLYGNPEAMVARLDLDAQVGLDSVYTLSTSLRAQKSNDPLMNYEEFSIGSLSIGRGYDPGAASGDDAIAIRSELRANAYRGRNVGAEVFAFVDNAWLWNHDLFWDRNGTASLVDDRVYREPGLHLSSAGIGTRVSLPGNLLLEAMYARPLIRLPGTRDEPTDRLLLSLTAQFAPPPAR